MLVDTDAFVHLTRGQAKARELAPYVESRRVVLSFVTVAEMRRGAYRRNYRERSWRRMEADIASAIVVAATDAVSHEWARLTHEARRDGHALGQPAQKHDAWIAATARHYGLPILTLDADYERFPGLRLLPNPR